MSVLFHSSTTMLLCAKQNPYKNDLLSLSWSNLTDLHKLTPLITFSMNLNADQTSVPNLTDALFSQASTLTWTKSQTWFLNDWNVNTAFVWYDLTAFRVCSCFTDIKQRQNRKNRREVKRWNVSLTRSVWNKCTWSHASVVIESVGTCFGHMRTPIPVWDLI